MTWEETILFARNQKEYEELIKQCYLTSDLVWNIEQYGNSEEYKEILKLIKEYAPHAKTLMEFGAGNGIASINFAFKGYDVFSTEPDKSETVGAGAIRKSVKYFDLKNISVVESFAEELIETDDKFDIVFARQCMHHANNLKLFAKNAFRMLKPGGIFLAIRDHVINSENDKQEFLKEHPFHKFYGGENAFTLQEYESALTKAGFRINEILGYFDNVINHFPEKDPFGKVVNERNEYVKNRFPALGSSPIARRILIKLFELKHGQINDDRNIVGRMYSFIAIK